MRNKAIYKSYKRGQVVYADFGHRASGVQSGIRPCVVISCDRSNHCRAPQITVCPLSTKNKPNRVHVQIHPLDVNGYHLRKISDFLPEDMQTISKKDVRGIIGFIQKDSEIMKKINAAIIMQLGLAEMEVGKYGEHNPEESRQKKICQV